MGEDDRCVTRAVGLLASNEQGLGGGRKERRDRQGADSNGRDGGQRQQTAVQQYSAMACGAPAIFFNFLIFVLQAGSGAPAPPPPILLLDFFLLSKVTCHQTGTSGSSRLSSIQALEKKKQKCKIFLNIKTNGY